MSSPSASAAASAFSFSATPSSSSFTPFQFKEADLKDKTPGDFQKILEKFCPLIHVEDHHLPVNVESFVAEGELRRRETKYPSFLSKEREDHVVFPRGSCSFEKMGNIKIDENCLLRGEFDSKSMISTIFFHSQAKGSLSSPIYASVLNPQDEEEGIPKPSPFLDLLYCFLLSPPESYWECIVVRIDNNFANILGVCLNYLNLSHPLRGWCFPPSPTALSSPSSSSSSSSSASSPSSPELMFEVQEGTKRPILYFGRGGRMGANSFLSPKKQEGENALWDPSVVAIAENNPIVRYRGRWSESNKDFQQLQKIFSTRAAGGPSPLRVLTCPVKWEEKKSSEGVFYSGSSSLSSDVMLGKRSSHFFSINNGRTDLMWSIYDHLKKRKAGVTFSVMGMDGGCLYKDAQSGVKTTGFLSPKPNSTLYLSRIRTKEKPSTEIEFLYVCITETDFHSQLDPFSSMVIPRKVAVNKKPQTPKQFLVVWEADPSYVLDLRNGTNAHDLVVLKKKKKGRTSQVWEFKECSNDWSRRSHLINCGSGMALDIRGGSKSGAFLQQYPVKTSSVDNQMVTYSPQKKKLCIGSYVVVLKEGKEEKGREELRLYEGEEKGNTLVTQRDSNSLKTKTLFSLESVNEEDYKWKKGEGDLPVLDVVVTRNAEKIFDDENSGAVPVSVSIFNPIPPKGYFRVGSYGQQGYSPVMDGYSTLIRKKKDMDFIPFTDPAEYKLVWSTQGSWAKRSVWVWEMVPPPGFVAFGAACTTTKAPPATNTFKVVHESLCHWVLANFTENNQGLGFPLWADQRTGSKLSITLWKASSPSHHPSFPPSSPSSSPRDVTSSSLSLILPIRSRSFPTLDLFPELLFSSFLRLEKSKLDGYVCVEEYKPRNFAGIHCAVRTVCDVTPVEGDLSQIDFNMEEEEEEGEEGAKCDRKIDFEVEEGVQRTVVLPVAHSDEGELMRMVQNWVVNSQIKIGREMPVQRRRDFTLEGHTYVPFYQFEVCAHVKKDWKEVGEKEGAAHFFGEEVEVIDFACADPSQMNIFAEMKTLGFFPPSPPSPFDYFLDPLFQGKEGEEEEEGERVRAAEETRFEFYSEGSDDGEEVDGFGFLCGWKQAWKTLESSIIHQILEHSGSFVNEKAYLCDVRFLVQIKSLKITLFYHPLLKCSFLWGNDRTSVWIDGLSEKVFTSDALKMHSKKEKKERRGEREKAAPCFVSGSKLMSLDKHMKYNPYRTYLTLPNPASMGHFGMWNRGCSPVVIQAVYRNNGNTVGTPVLIPPGQQFTARYQNNAKEMAVCVMSGDSSHLHLTLADSTSYSKTQHLNLLNASTY